MKRSFVCLLLAFQLAAASASEVQAANLQRIQANDNRASAGRLRNGHLRLELEAREGLWFPETEAGPGVPVQAFAERGKPLQVPGPLIRIREGTRVRVGVKNTLASKLALHGLHSRPGDARDAVELQPGERRELEFEAGVRGTYSYWGSTMKGGPVTGLPIYRDAVLTGGFIVDGRDEVPDSNERVFMITQWHENPDLDQSALFIGDPKQRRTAAINGLAWPFTERLTYDLGKPVRWRWINSSSEYHPLHLHGFYYDILSLGDGERDEALAPAMQPHVVTYRMAPRATMSLAWTPDRSGNWLFHCHILDHIDPSTRLRAPPAYTAGRPHAADHVRDAMSGLVLGVTVRASATRAAAATPVTRREMQLFIQEQPNRFGDAPALGYVLTTNKQQPPAATVEIPGPLILLTRGEPTSIEIVNRTREETSVHWHGMELESYFDGVPGWGGDSLRVTPPIRPGESFVAMMTPPRAGTFIYHTHWHDVHQLSSGMYGPLVVLEPGSQYDRETERMILISAGPSAKRFAEPILVNGSEKPAPLQMKVGSTYRLRLINITADNANIDLTLSKDDQPVTWRAIAKDGMDLPVAQALESKADRQSLTTGETRDYELRPIAAGDYKFEVRNIAGKVRATLMIEVH